jgi:hypothetical protein
LKLLKGMQVCTHTTGVIPTNYLLAFIYILRMF